MGSIISFIMLLISLTCLIISRINNIYILMVIFKATSSLLFLVVAYVSQKGCQKKPPTTYFKLMFLGLFFSLIGDVLLVFQGLSEIFFIFGVLGFACAHISYTAAFFRFGSLSKLNIGLTVIIFSVLLWMITRKQWVDLGDMKAVVIGYAVLLSFMAAKSFSVLQFRKDYPYFVYLTLIGALFFLISDCLLLFAFFGKGDLSYLETVNNVIYYIGQGLFGLSFCNEFLVFDKK